METINQKTCSINEFCTNYQQKLLKLDKYVFLRENTYFNLNKDQFSNDKSRT